MWGEGRCPGRYHHPPSQEWHQSRSSTNTRPCCFSYFWEQDERCCRTLQSRGFGFCTNCRWILGGLPSCCYRAAEEDCFCSGPSHRPRGVRGYPPSPVSLLSATPAGYCFSFNNSLFPSPTVLARNVLRQQGRGNGGAISALSTPKTWCDLRAIHTKSWCE